MTRWRWDHPRGCGEHLKYGIASRGLAGSSPRMRGAQRCSLLSVLECRIIPADAGSTPWRSAACRPALDHPRGCGEHLIGLWQPGKRTGSSPRMRGAPVEWCQLVVFDGIIPADAGSTSSLPQRRSASMDHPRGCGEHGSELGVALRVWGSSPRMRGAPHSARSTGMALRIIPADAGSTALVLHRHKCH